MDIFHPFVDRRRALELDAATRAIVAELPELPKIECGEYNKKYWADMGLGLVPAGKYTDPTTKEAAAAVEALYAGLKGAKITRHRVALALGFQSADQVDRIRSKELYPAGVTISRGRPGVSVRWTGPVEDVIKAQAAKRTAKKASA